MIPNDMEVNGCSAVGCEVNTWTVLRRPHHCRCCGRVYCNSCSSSLELVPNVGGEGYDKPQRVCTSCSEHLKRGESDCIVRRMSVCRLSLVNPLEAETTYKVENLLLLADFIDSTKSNEAKMRHAITLINRSGGMRVIASLVAARSPLRFAALKGEEISSRRRFLFITQFSHSIFKHVHHMQCFQL